ncbi:glycosyl transferase family A [Sutcliffiella cohnii]|uniref:Glycosyl transferase family A n=1 Tax=Sutcliffiella cohnii TaxID=33932 RepID=A0A223KVH0_9BACI|nr:glycosyl transferase family A [Sutcliffiella cohnii]
MLKILKKRIINILEWFFYKFFNSSQRRKIFTLLSSKNRKRVKKLFKKGKTQTNLRKIEQLRYKLRNLGFFEEALKDLEDLYKNSPNAVLRKSAAWEIALWHANKQTPEGAKECLKYIPFLYEGEQDKEQLRQITIIEAECLIAVNKNEEAKRTLLTALKREEHPDLFLALANCETNVDERLKWINKMYTFYRLTSVLLEEETTKNFYDNLSHKKAKAVYKENSGKVSIIIPVYNAEDVIETSLNSVLTQTWKNLEIIVVDDCSSDSTVQLVEEIQKKDERLKLVKASKNGGAYTARNLALQVATGDFITINDADDWSHPEKIEKQVTHLLNNPRIIGNTSQQARATENLKFFRRGKPGLYIFSNMSSFMFRRKKVTKALGYWDCVRFGADSEFIKRIKHVFGEDSILELPTGPLSFQRQSESSLTGNSYFGFPGYFMGARKEYLEAQVDYHKKAENLYYDFPQKNRPFPIPEPMKPNRLPRDTRKHFDVIILSDFRLDGGSTLSSVEEIKAHKQIGLKTGLIQLARYDYSPKKKINQKVRDLLDGENVEMIVYGENVSCDTLIVRYPPVLQVKQEYIPNVEAKEIRLIINQTPMSDYGPQGVLRYDLKTVKDRLIEYFGNAGIWHPIGPLVRQALENYHSQSLSEIPLAKEDWTNIINLNDWKENDRQISESKANNIVIGRHSRDNVVKWPNDKEQLLSIYPEQEEYEVRVLGGANSVKDVLGYIPENWSVYKFGEVAPKEFLANLDVFVYFTHPNWIESYGRVIIEAMAVGIPVILPKQYEILFGEAAIYSKPSEVKNVINNLLADPHLYEEQIEKGWNYVKENASYETHYRRLKLRAYNN